VEITPLVSASLSALLPATICRYSAP